MYREHTIGVVVPAYNEEGFVGDVITEMPPFVDRLYVVDDRSTDGTWDEIRAAARADAGVTGDLDGSAIALREPLFTDGGEPAPLKSRATVHDPIGRVVPIRHRENRGAGGAIKTGYLAARADGVDITATVDGDGQMDLNQLPKLLDPIVEGRVDYAKGNRLLHDGYAREMPAFRLLGNSILSLLTKVSSGYWKLSDSQNGYTAISRSALTSVDIEAMYEYYGYCNDLLVKLNAQDTRVAEIAMPAQYGDEESGIEYTMYIPKVSRMLLQNFLWRLKARYLLFDFHPVALFYLFGSAVTAFGVLSMLWATVVWKRFDRSLFVRGALSGLLFITGSLFLLFAMLFDMQANEDRVEVVYE